MDICLGLAINHLIKSSLSKHSILHTKPNHENQMNIQTELAQVDTEIAELQTKLLKAQERRELLASIKPACDAASEAIDKALDVLCLVELSNDFGLAEIAKFKKAIDSKFKFMEDERAIQAEAKVLHVVKREASSRLSYAPFDYENTVFADKFFPDRPAQREQFKIIVQELQAVGIKVGKAIANRSDAKGWHLRWGQDKAGLFWTVGQGWGVEALKSGDELTGNWESFDLDQHLECNGVDLDEYVA